MSRSTKKKNMNALVLLTWCICTLAFGTTYAFNWHKCIGQGGGSAILGVDVDPNNDSIVYVCGDYDSGIWKSTNSGETWRQIDNGLECYYVMGVTVTPRNSSVIFAATRMGPHKSTDGGLTWAKKRTGMPTELSGNKVGYSAPTNQVVVHPTNSDIVYACVGYSHVLDLEEGGAFNRADNGLWKSTDAGENWGKVTGYPAEIGANTVVFDPQNPNRMWVGTGGDTLNISKWGVYRSDDAGATWTRVSTGLGDSVNVFKIVLHPTNQDIAYCIVSGRMVPDYNTPQQSPVWWTTNGGTSWVSRSNNIALGSRGLNWPWRGLVMDPKNSNILYYNSQGGGIQKTTNGGAEWYGVTFNNTPEDNYWSYKNRYNTSGTLTWEGSIWYSNSCLAHGNQRSVIYANTIGVVVRGLNEGHDWSSPCTRQRNTNPEDGYFRSTGFANYYLYSLTFDPKDPKYVYCTNGDSERFLKSDDGGMHWRYVMRGCRDEWLGYDRSNVVVDPDDGRVLYFAETGRTLGSCYRSTDRGETWKEIRHPNAALHIQITMAPGGTVDTRTLFTYARTGGLFRTTNSGTSWIAVNNGLDMAGAWGNAGRVAVDPTNRNIVYAGGGRGIFKSTNCGESWTNVSNATVQGVIKTIAINPVNPQNVFVGTLAISGTTTPGRLFRTTNGGETWDIPWTWTGTYYRPATQVNDVVFDPNDPTGKTMFGSRLKWGRYEKDIDYENPYMSTDGGTTWTSIAAGLNYYYTSCLAVNPHDSTLWLGTWGNGMARISIPHLKGNNPNWNGEWPEPTSVKFSSAKVSRVGMQTIRFEAARGILWVPVNGTAMVEVFDVAGRKIHGSQVVAISNAQIQMHSMASGMCVVKVSNAQGSKQYRIATVR